MFEADDTLIDQFINNHLVNLQSRIPKYILPRSSK
jgi:hypothetical protein